MDAERDATLAYLDDVTRRFGGRRGRAGVAVETSGLVFAHTRHATSRAGDPAPHDHVLVANLVEMRDERGGWKAADTTVWREHLHAATVTGRVAGARRAVELGYGIEADDGPSGRLGQWRIAGIPLEAEEVFSKRAAEVTAAVAEPRRRLLPGPPGRRPHHPHGEAVHAGRGSDGTVAGRARRDRAHTRSPGSRRRPGGPGCPGFAPGVAARPVP